MYHISKQTNKKLPTSNPLIALMHPGLPKMKNKKWRENTCRPVLRHLELRDVLQEQELSGTIFNFKPPPRMQSWTVGKTIWNCWKTAPLRKCSDTVCLSCIKTSKNPGTSETCRTCKSLCVLTFQGSENCRTLGCKQEEEHVASIEKPRTSGTCGLLGWCHLSTNHVLWCV